MDSESPVQPDSALVGLFQQGTAGERQQAFCGLYERHAGPVCGYLARLTRDAHLAEDLTQETFLRALKALGRFHGQSSFKTWVYRIATNLFKDHLKRRKTMSQNDQMVWKGTAVESPVEFAERQEEARRVQAAVDALPEDLREPILLVRLDGLSYQQAAEVLGLNLTTLRMRVHRAHLRLVEALN